MHFLQPVQGAGNQEVLYLVAAEIEDQGGPVQVLAETRILVLIERRAVKAGETVGILWEMRRHPVQQYADVMAMAVVYEIAGVIGCAEPAGRGIVAGSLVSP